MTEPRPFASLTSSLLARKGFARPAMRPQHALPGPGDDLGWNDMGLYDGYDGDLSAPDELPDTPRAPTSAYLTPLPQSDAPAVSEAPLPVVLQQQAEIAQGLGAIAEGMPPAPAKAPRRKKANGAKPAARNGKTMALPPTPPLPVATGGRKAAFTLRLDPERHLRLRLACAVGHRSAQKLLIEALDNYLESVAGLDELADHASGGSAA